MLLKETFDGIPSVTLRNLLNILPLSGLILRVPKNLLSNRLLTTEKNATLTSRVSETPSRPFTFGQLTQASNEVCEWNQVLRRADILRGLGPD